MKNRKTSLFNCLDKVQRLFFVALFSVLAITASAQSKSVSGTVVDKAGEPVIGASVVVKGTTTVQLPISTVISLFRVFLTMELFKSAS